MLIFQHRAADFSSYSFPNTITKELPEKERKRRERIRKKRKEKKREKKEQESEKREERERKREKKMSRVNYYQSAFNSQQQQN